VNFAESQRNPGKHPTGLIIVVIMHVLLAYALVSGLAKKVVDKVMVTETKLVEAPPPPPIAPQITTTNVMPPPAPEPRLSPPSPPAPPAPAAPPQTRAAVVTANDPSCRPDYPAAAARAQVTGISRIRFTVDANAKVVAAEVVSPSGPTREHRLLDNAAKSALATCPIKVGTDAEGRPIGTVVEVIYTWKLE
jgi:protein TonB